MSRLQRFAVLRTPRQPAQLGFILPSRPTAFTATPASTSTLPSVSHPVSYARSFTVSATQLASEAPRDPFASSSSFSQDVPLFDRLQQAPEVIEAITNLSNLAREKTGVDLARGDKPTLPMMMKLAQDPELKEAAGHLMATLKDAGINVDPRQAFAALKSIGEGFDKVDLGDLHGGSKKGDGEKK